MEKIPPTLSNLGLRAGGPINSSYLVFGLWLDVNDEERARRVAHREGLTLEAASEANARRSEVDGARFRALYDLVPEDPEPYTHVVDASTLNASQILEHVVALLEASP